MNSLSWLLYWADVCGAIGGSVGFFAVLLSFLLIFLIISHCVLRACAAQGYPAAQSALVATGTGLKIGVPLVAALGLVAIFVPSRETIYAIAASEMGEEVLKAPEASKARQALNAWLDKQIPGKTPDQAKPE